MGDPAIGAINPTADAISITNSNILIDKDYIADAGTGIAITTSGARGAMTPQIENDGIVGNVAGVRSSTAGRRGVNARPVQIINDDFAVQHHRPAT